MSDQGKWFKLWESVLDDPSLCDLSHEDWARWVRLGVFIKKHGEAGELLIKAPALMLQSILWVRSFEEVLGVVKRLPGYVIEDTIMAPLHVQLRANEEMTSQTLPTPLHVTIASVTYKIKSKNWHKYQGDFSVLRVRKFRERKALHVTANVTAQEERRGEEKRGDKKRVFVIPTIQEISDYVKTEKIDLDAKRFFDFYESKGWVVGRSKMKDWKAAARNWARNGGLFDGNQRQGSHIGPKADPGKYDHLYEH